MDTLQARLARGDRKAFAELYDACADRMHHYLVARLGSRTDADDVLQETFLRLARDFRKLNDIENLDAYAFAVARNEFLRFVANRSRRGRAQLPLTGDDLFIVDCQRIDAKEDAETVAAALRELSPELREVIDLKTYGGLTFQQISQVMGLPQGTVATRYRSALEKMRQWFARQA